MLLWLSCTDVFAAFLKESPMETTILDLVNICPS